MGAQTRTARFWLAVSVCALSAVIGLLLHSRYSNEERVRYWTTFDESTLGLGKDGLVVYLGVPVGKVHDIYMTAQKVTRVEIEVFRRKAALKEGVTAQLQLYSLATGTMCVSLNGGDPEGKALKPGAQIPTQKSLVESVGTRFNGILKNMPRIDDTLRDDLRGKDKGRLPRRSPERAPVPERRPGKIDT